MSTALHIDRIIPGNHQALIDSTEVHSTEAHIVREHVSPCALGSAVPGDASCPGRLGRGSDMRLGAADKMPAPKAWSPSAPASCRRSMLSPQEDRHQAAKVRREGNERSRLRAQAGAGTVTDARHRPQGGCLDGEHRERGGTRCRPLSATM